MFFWLLCFDKKKILFFSFCDHLHLFCHFLFMPIVFVAYWFIFWQLLCLSFHQRPDSQRTPTVKCLRQHGALPHGIWYLLLGSWYLAQDSPGNTGSDFIIYLRKTIFQNYLGSDSDCPSIFLSITRSSLGWPPTTDQTAHHSSQCPRQTETLETSSEVVAASPLVARSQDVLRHTSTAQTARNAVVERFGAKCCY